MTDQEWVLHDTSTRRLSSEEGEGWEFTCAVCGYWARYMIDDPLLGPGMTVFNMGDPHARHTSSDWKQEFLETTRPAPAADEHGFDLTVPATEDDLSGDAEEDWLTPELRSQIQDILEKHGF